MNNIINLCKSLTNQQEAIIHTVTEVKMNKKDVATKTVSNPYLGATRKSLTKVLLNPQYEKMVNDSREANGEPRDFVAGERPWGVNIGNGLVEHNEQLYVSYVVLENIPGSTYEFEGKPIEYELLKPFVPVKKEEVLAEGDFPKVDYRTVKASNIVFVSVVVGKE